MILKNEVVDLREKLNYTIGMFGKNQVSIPSYDQYSHDKFMSENTDDYSKTHHLNCDARYKLLSAFDKIDFLCISYLSDCYGQNIYRWNEVFIINDKLRKAINLICMYGTTETIEYLLNMVSDKCDMFLEKRLSWGYVTDDGLTPFLICCCNRLN